MRSHPLKPDLKSTHFGEWLLPNLILTYSLWLATRCMVPDSSVLLNRLRVCRSQQRFCSADRSQS